MKNLRIKLLIVAIMAVLALYLWMQNKTGTLRQEIGEFAIDDTASVTRIFLADMRGNDMLLTKIKPGEWSLNDTLSARNEAVTRLLSSMFRMAVQAPVSRSAYNSVIKNLAANSVKVEIYQHLPRINIFNSIRLFYREKLSKVYYVGEPTQDNLGTYMLMEGSDTPFIVYLPGLRGFLSARFSANPNDWRDHTIFAKSPHEIRSIRVDFPQTPEESYLVEKLNRNDLRLTRVIDNHKVTDFDPNHLINLIHGYRDVRFESIVGKNAELNIDSLLVATPVHVITLTDTSGNVYRMKTYRRHNFGLLMTDDGEPYPYDIDRMYGLINNGKDLVLIQYFVFDPITRPLSFFTGYKTSEQ
ncbi:MAG: DUF4340 domain-containing protein [Bacteroidales bacterium]|nr:DUF4340 domain-containing protein [Bacteroidales bacterium]